jgi:two-component system, OmpR family, response regulator RegX3
MPRVLIVEDDDAMRDMVGYALAEEGMEVEAAADGESTLEIFSSSGPFDLVILDVMLPGIDGVSVCKELTSTSDVPVIMLTARGSEADRVAGLEMGADDYVVKPFSAREVIARVRAVLRRAQPKRGDGAALEIAEVRLDPDAHIATLGGEQLELSRKEFALLQALMEQAGSVITRQALIEDVWDMNWFGSTKTLDVHMSALRKKLGDDAAEPRYIHTVRGVGFRFAGPDET